MNSERLRGNTEFLEQNSTMHKCIKNNGLPGKLLGCANYRTPSHAFNSKMERWEQDRVEERREKKNNLKLIRNR